MLDIPEGVPMLSYTHTYISYASYSKCQLYSAEVHSFPYKEVKSHEIKKFFYTVCGLGALLIPSSCDGAMAFVPCAITLLKYLNCAWQYYNFVREVLWPPSASFEHCSLHESASSRVGEHIQMSLTYWKAVLFKDSHAKSCFRTWLNRSGECLNPCGSLVYVYCCPKYVNATGWRIPCLSTNTPSREQQICNHNLHNASLPNRFSGVPSEIKIDIWPVWLFVVRHTGAIKGVSWTVPENPMVLAYLRRCCA